MTAFLVAAAVTAVFALVLAVRASANVRACAICAGVSVTWTALLAARALGVSVDPVLVAVLVGESATGAMYLLERKLPERLHIFKLPFLLTVTLAAYAALDADGGRTWAPYAFLAALWTAFGLVHALRRGTRGRVIAARLIECCKNW